MSTDVSSHGALSSYEVTRAKNIERNNARLRSLGLISAREEEKSNDAAWGRQTKSPTLADDSLPGGECRPGGNDESRKKRRELPMAPREGSRKSRRIMNLPAERSNVSHKACFSNCGNLIYFSHKK